MLSLKTYIKSIFIDIEGDIDRFFILHESYKFITSKRFILRMHHTNL